VAVVTPQNWLFLTRYKKLREKLLKERTWNLVARLGPGAFETIGGHVVNVALDILSAGKPEEDAQMAGLDASSGQTPSNKAALLRGEVGGITDAGKSSGDGTQATNPPGEAMSHDVGAGPLAPAAGSVHLIPQAAQLKNAESRVLMAAVGSWKTLNDYAVVSEGLHTGDYPRFGRKHWEFSGIRHGWERQQGGTSGQDGEGGCEHVLFWEEGQGELIRFIRARLESDTVSMWIKGEEVWGKRGVAIGTMSELNYALYHGFLFTHGIVAVVPRDERDGSAILAFVESPEFRINVRLLDQKVSVARGAFEQTPLDIARWRKVAAEKYPHGLPEPQSNDPTQWLFHGHPAGMVAAGPADRSPWGIADPVGADRHPSLICREPNPKDVLQVAIVRLVGYRWPTEHDPTLRLDEAARAWADRCRELDAFADEDGIVCLNAIRGEAGAADRLRRLLAAAFGSEWSATKERALLAAAAGDGKSVGSLEEWLRDRFFEEHCKLFHHRPFIWHIWDGRKDGFHALVNYHRLAGPDGEGRRTLEALTYSYLGDWIERQKAEQREGKDGDDARLAAALDLRAQLERILEGEPPCDIFVRWKPLHQQPIGWEPDINDGVRLNIRPFMSVELRKGGRKGAGILRWKPNIKWKKDRGKEPQSLRPREDYPWFWNCPGDGTLAERTDFLGGAEFDGNRWNDLHYTKTVKRAARHRAAGRESG